jgi:hypothetical protein
MHKPRQMKRINAELIQCLFKPPVDLLRTSTCTVQDKASTQRMDRCTPSSFRAMHLGSETLWLPFKDHMSYSACQIRLTLFN